MALVGPTHAPKAARSLTSPAPMPPSRNHGRNSAHPTAHPARLHSEPDHPFATPKKTTAAADAPNVSTFGILRDLKSVMHAATPIATTAACWGEISIIVTEDRAR